MSKTKLHAVPKTTVCIDMLFESNELALQIFGSQEKNLKLLQKHLGVFIKSCGNTLTIEGPEAQVFIAEKTLLFLKEKLICGESISKTDLLDGIRINQNDNPLELRTSLQQNVITFSKRKIYPKTQGQLQYIQAIQKHDIVFGIGPAGTGKTYLAMAVGMTKLLRGEVEHIILTRPAVEAGEKLGFLPGDLAEKVNPYLRPLYDALHDMIDYERVLRMITTGQIEIAPIAFMRGRTLNNSYVILDEAQNCTREQMKMFLTRLGENCQAVITGDITQIDLPKETKSGLIQAIKILNKIDGIAIHQFDERDVVRHPLVAKIIKAYEQAKKVP